MSEHSFSRHQLFVALEQALKRVAGFVPPALPALTWIPLQFLVTQGAASFPGRIRRNVALLLSSSWRT